MARSIEWRNMKEKAESSVDPSVLTAAQKGDMAALGALLDHFDGLIRSVPAWGKWHFSPSVQEDICQNIRMELQKSIASYKKTSSLDYFVKRICIHRCIDEVRRQVKKRRVFTPLIHVGPDGKPFQIEAMLKDGEAFDPLTLIALSERAARLKSILQDEVPDACRQVIHWFYFEELSYKEMAERLEITTVTVGTRLSKCLSKLRAMLKKDEFFGEGRCASSDYSPRRTEHEHR